MVFSGPGKTGFFCRESCSLGVALGELLVGLLVLITLEAVGLVVLLW